MAKPQPHWQGTGPGPHPGITRGSRQLTGGQPSALPTVFTIGSSGVQYMSAPNQAHMQINVFGSLNPNGVDTHWYFIYNTNPAVTAGTPVQTSQVDGGSGTSLVTTTATITNLTPGQTYYYALVGTSAAGTVYGPTLSVVAALPITPSTPQTVRAPSTEQDIITPHLQWPFTLTSKGAAVVEQQSLADIYSQVQVFWNVEQHSIPELPIFGRPDLTFSQMPLDVAGLTQLTQRTVPGASLEMVTQALDAVGSDWQLTITVSADTVSQG